MQNSAGVQNNAQAAAASSAAARAPDTQQAGRPMEEIAMGVLGRECKVPLESMGLFELCAVKFRIMQRLENNRGVYNLVRTKKAFVDEEESEYSQANTPLRRRRGKRVDESQINSDEEEGGRKRYPEPKKVPGVPGGRRRVGWDNLLNEIPNIACGIQEESKFKLAEASHLCRKARKEVQKKDNQSKGLKEYKKLLSTQIALQVTKLTRFMIMQNVLVNSAFPSPQDEIVNSASEELSRIVKMNAEAAELNSDTPFNMEIDKLEKSKQSYLREIHKVLSKWNKPQVKHFLKSQLFESVDTIVEERTGHNWQWQSSQSVASTNVSITANQIPILPTGNAPQPAPAPVGVAVGASTGVVVVAKDSKKEDIKEKELNRLLKSENSDEFTALYLNRTAMHESFKKVFKTSIDTFPSFPKSIEEVPVAPLVSLKETEIWENRTFFGTQAETQVVESGMTQFFEEIAIIAKEFPEQISLTNLSANSQNFVNHHEMVFKALAKGMVIIYEQIPTAERGDGPTGLDTCIKILNPSRPDHFLDEFVSATPFPGPPDYLPLVAFLHPLLHYTLHRLENRFGRRWFWIETLLKSNPLFKGFKLCTKTIGKLSTFFHMLSGERVILNHRQQFPGERTANMEFFPTDTNSKKRLIPGRKPKNRSREKEELDYKSFAKKFKEEILRLPWNLPAESKLCEDLYFNKACEFVSERAKLNFKRFKPARGRQTMVSGLGLHTAGSSTSAKAEPKLERFNDRSPSEELNSVADKQRGTGIPNYIKHLKKRKSEFDLEYKEEFDNNPLIKEIEKIRSSLNRR